MRRGFTLLELLVVLAIVATVAGTAIMTAGGVEEEARNRLDRAESMALKKAVLAFYRDTGHLPRQGPFALQSEGGAVPAPPQGSAWFHSPANLVQLYENPLAGTGHALETWDPDRKRGWNGPYLSRGTEGRVQIGDGLSENGTGSPTSGTLLDPMPGLADPHSVPPVGNYYTWESWGGQPLERQGRPWFLFDLDSRTDARLVGHGPDGVYGTADDITRYLLR